MRGLRSAAAGAVLLAATGAGCDAGPEVACVLTVAAVRLLAPALRVDNDLQEVLGVLDPALRAACGSTVRTMLEQPSNRVTFRLDTATGRIVARTTGGDVAVPPPPPTPPPTPTRETFRHLLDCFTSYDVSGFLFDLCVEYRIDP